VELKARSSNGVKIVELAGRFDTYTAAPVRRWLEENVGEKTAHVVVNLANVHFVDSTALATLVQGMKRCRQFEGDLRLCNLQQPVRMIFELTRLDKAFEILATEEAAVAAFADQPAVTYSTSGRSMGAFEG
jgi:anti-sigma B factor antagonist